ncbi:MAG: hypothetical protein FJ100_24030 [Deltaproteobacteria bacterium]|nr:hypothetical protein [Deltaproteobacteria bacterium]
MADQDLARRAVACTHWRWLPGTAAYRLEGRKQYRLVRDSVWCAGDGADPYTCALADMLPDLDDAATRGCLLELVRRAWGDHAAPRVYSGSTEVAALVAALEEP